MNNEWKMVPVEPTKEMVAAALQLSSRWPHDHWKAMLAASPVPPAGDVEVLATLDRSCDSGVTLTDTGASWHMDGTDLVDIDHVTRLTAERDRHAHNSKEWESASLHWMAEYDKSQSELTKAREDADEADKLRKEFEVALDSSQSELNKLRELMNIMYWHNPREPNESDCDQIELQINALAHQSAPAAKGGAQ